MIVVWRVTEKCNFGCPFCAYDRNVDRPRREADPALILSFGRILADYAGSSGEAVLVSWLGGEPLLWPPLKELTEAYRCGFGLKVSTTTNGSLLVLKEIRTHLIDHYAELTVSVDGIGATHDQLRDWPEAYARIRQSVLNLVEEKRRLGHGPRLRANVVLMSGNFEEFEPLCLELASWGVELVTFNQLGGRDRPEFYAGHRLLPRQADRLARELPRLRALLATKGLCLQGGREYLRRIQASTRGEKLPIEDCPSGNGFLFIDETGTAAPCAFTVGELGLPVGEVDSVQALYALREQFANERRRLTPTACNDCHSTQVFHKFEGGFDEAGRPHP